MNLSSPKLKKIAKPKKQNFLYFSRHFFIVQREILKHIHQRKIFLILSLINKQNYNKPILYINLYFPILNKLFFIFW